MQSTHGSSAFKDSELEYEASSTKRQKRLLSNSCQSDPDYEASSAKRQRRLPSSSCQSDPDSIVSSVCQLPGGLNGLESYSPLNCSLESVPESPNSCSDSTITYNSTRFQHRHILSDDENDDDGDGDVEEDNVEGNNNYIGTDQLNCRSTRTDRSDTMFKSVNTSTTEDSPGAQEEKQTTNELTASKAHLNVLQSAYLDCMTPAAEAEPDSNLACPLPALAWANANDVWQLMCKKDELAALLRNPNMLEQHPSLQPRMRTILLDWLIEVCEVYKLHRETYFLAVDYVDRYLTAKKEVQKIHLQLLGITCLFVAAKVEEIYPPKIGEFAYVTDGACLECDILEYEKLLLETLSWSITPVTPVSWLSIYMQLDVSSRQVNALRHSENHEGGINNNNIASTFLYPQFSGLEFSKAAQLLDLCTLDLAYGNFSYSVLAATALCHTLDKEIALHCSGQKWSDIEDCMRWMTPFYHIVMQDFHSLQMLEQNEQLPTSHGIQHICPNLNKDESYLIQTHSTSVPMLDRVYLVQEQYATIPYRLPEASPAAAIKSRGMLTPPTSSQKPDSTDLDDKEHNEE